MSPEKVAGGATRRTGLRVHCSPCPAHAVRYYSLPPGMGGLLSAERNLYQPITTLTNLRVSVSPC